VFAQQERILVPDQKKKSDSVVELPPLVPNTRWLTVDQAAAYLQVIPNTIRNLIHDGSLKAARLGYKFRIERVDLDLMMTRRKRVVPPYRRGLRPWVSARHAENRKRAAAC
jgi:excisionase family DNA binding protein